MAFAVRFVVRDPARTEVSEPPRYRHCLTFTHAPVREARGGVDYESDFPLAVGDTLFLFGGEWRVVERCSNGAFICNDHLLFQMFNHIGLGQGIDDYVGISFEESRAVATLVRGLPQSRDRDDLLAAIAAGLRGERWVVETTIDTIAVLARALKQRMSHERHTEALERLGLCADSSAQMREELRERGLPDFAQCTPCRTRHTRG